MPDPTGSGGNTNTGGLADELFGADKREAFLDLWNTDTQGAHYKISDLL